MIRLIGAVLAGAFTLNAEARSSEYDLDGDGRPDRVRYERNPEGSYRLAVNGSSVSGFGEGLHAEVLVVDVDSTDHLREIAVQEDGPSDDYLTTFFVFDRGNVREIGKVPGTYGLKVDGSGRIYTKVRGAILQTWFYPAVFILDAQHILKQVTQPLYAMGTPCRVKRSFPLRASPEDPTIVAYTSPGDSLRIVASDDKRWCLVQVRNGLWGWFEVMNYDVVVPINLRACDLLDGLSYAD